MNTKNDFRQPVRNQESTVTFVIDGMNSYYSQNKSLTVIERCDIMEWVMKNEPIPDKQ